MFGLLRLLESGFDSPNSSLDETICLRSSRGCSDMDKSPLGGEFCESVAGEMRSVVCHELSRYTVLTENLPVAATNASLVH